MLMMKPFLIVTTMRPAMMSKGTCGRQAHDYDDGTGDDDGDDDMMLPPMAMTTMLLVAMSRVTSI